MCKCADPKCAVTECRNNPINAPEFSLDWPHGHKYRNSPTEVVFMGRNPVVEGLLVFAEKTKQGTTTNVTIEGKNRSGLTTYDIINKPKQKEKIIRYSFPYRYQDAKGSIGVSMCHATRTSAENHRADMIRGGYTTGEIVDTIYEI